MMKIVHVNSCEVRVSRARAARSAVALLHVCTCIGILTYGDHLDVVVRLMAQA